MAARISLLDEKVINRIAAGEVVERPASVVKELLENSLDADPTSIRIEIEQGGKKLIRVSDNGIGMSGDDAFMALERHATSKLKSEQDLVGIATLGFRGEALASIGSVSRLTLVTYDGEDEAGTIIRMEGGALRSTDRIGSARGTTIEVADLFFNVPARKKFLKKNDTEAGHIRELVPRAALAFPHIAFTFVEDDKVRLDAPPVDSLLERIHSIYGKQVRENLIHVDESRGDLRFRGYIGRPPYVKSNSRSVLTFVNGRMVRDRVVNSAISRGLTHITEQGKYPFAVLFLELPPDHVDVNVHPQKAEVRFRRAQDVHDLITDGIHNALTGAPYKQPERGIPPDRPTPATHSVAHHVKGERLPPDESQPTSSSEKPADARPIPVARPDGPPPESVRPPPIPEHAPVPERFNVEPDRSDETFSGLGIIGNLPDSFLVLYDDDNLIVLDHHAAHERILFEDLMASDRRNEDVSSQGLLIPQLIELSSLESDAMARYVPLLNRIGFVIEEFGENDFIVKGVPTWLQHDDLTAFFEQLIKEMLETGVRGDIKRVKEELFRKTACSAAVKESNRLSPEEIKALLTDLDRIGGIETCPHGRPFTVRFPLKQIRKQMGRKI